ncbi:MAG: MarR family transcriptional regulator [Alphaproteobacteria bacterium HGW-Alphaproteobacteria-13]|nr:MAG: MarR family transcriptional regulator [Alphaproteobacteria bacterium HGW-Alphaproteobacteria-13]
MGRDGDRPPEFEEGAPAFFGKYLAARADAAAPWPAARDADAIASPLLFVGTGEAPSDLELVADARLAACVEPALAGGHARRMAQVDIIWLAAAETVARAAFDDLCAAAEERGAALICETSLAALDAIVAAVPVGLRAEYLVAPDAVDRQVALASARRTRRLELQDIARDDATERIDRLQEEVARISRLLGDLAAQRGGLAGTPGLAARRDDRDGDGRSAEVRSPVRGYAAPPRTFLPVEGAVERQHAKAVRRMLRQRRMREQYFPADLFADPAWDMLLDLYAARLEHHPVSVSSLCIAAAVPATTALRWIKTMTDAGLFVRESDPQDGRRIFIALADGASEAMARYFQALEE